MKLKKDNLKKIFNKIKNRNEYEDFLFILPDLKRLLPNFPSCVLEQWTFRHQNNFLHDYWNLNFESFEFTLENWETEKIYNNIGWKERVPIDFWGNELYARKNPLRMRTWLAKYYWKYKTWPKPVIILKVNQIQSYQSIKFSKDFHLLEGHMRLAYMRAQYRNKIENIPEYHPVWVVKIV